MSPYARPYMNICEYNDLMTLSICNLAMMDEHKLLHSDMCITFIPHDDVLICLITICLPMNVSFFLLVLYKFNI